MLRLAIDAIVSFTFAPLRAAYLMGFGLMLVTYCYLIYTFVLSVFYGVHLVPGWTSQLLITVAFGTACLVSIGFLGEYVGRIYDQTKGRPLYLVKDLVAKTPLSSEDARQGDERV
jgi:dolichol-phosphate mannosyltransferase